MSFNKEDSLKYAIFDKSDLSLIRVTYTGNKDIDVSFQNYLDELESCYEDREPIGILFDATKAIIPHIKHQKDQAFWIQKHWFLIKTYCKGTAYVIPNAASRAVLKMIFSFQHQPVPYKIFSTIDKATQWLNSLEDKKISQKS